MQKFNPTGQTTNKSQLFNGVKLNRANLERILNKKLIILTTICSIFCSCQKKKEKSIDPSLVFRTCFRAEPASVDTRRNVDCYTSNLHFLIYEGLTRSKPNGEIELALAETIRISEDNLVYEFDLREAYWSDGTRITAHDFEYSWKKILTPSFGSPSAHLFFILKYGEESLRGEKSSDEVGIRAMNDKTLRVELNNPTPYFLSLASFSSFYPIPRHVELMNPEWEINRNSKLVCSGPFRLIEWKPNHEIKLEKSPTYWDAERVELSEIDIYILPDEATTIQMFEQGDLDFISTGTTSLFQEDLLRFDEEGSLQICPFGGLVFCSFNLDQPLFSNQKIRRALSLSINRKLIASQIGFLHEEPAYRLLPPMMNRAQKGREECFARSFEPLPNSEVNNPDSFSVPSCLEAVRKEFAENQVSSNLMNQQIVHFEPGDALRLWHEGLEELNIPSQSLPPISLIYESSSQYRQIALALQDQWKNTLGIQIDIQELDSRSHNELSLNRQYSICLDYMIVQCNDPIFILDRFKYKNTKKNLPGFENEQYIQQLNFANQITDKTERLKILEAAEKIILSEMPIAPIFFMNHGTLVKPTFSQIEYSPTGNLIFKNIKPVSKAHESRKIQRPPQNRPF